MSAEPTIEGRPAPRRIGLCPEHGGEFYYPLRDGERPTCPVCSRELYVYIAKSGVSMIADERQRQLDEEGYDAAHDDTHTNAELPRAAACLAAPFKLYANPVGTVYTEVWPWNRGMAEPDRGADLDAKHFAYHEACMPEDPEARMRELAKAGALIAAEIDRLGRRRARD